MKDFQEENQILFEAIEAYRNGDRDKATIIYESTKKYTFNILHKEVERYKNQGALTSDVVSITEDIMQELYIEFFNKITNFRNEDPKSIFKWISVVAHRRLSTYVKENGTEVLQFEKDEDFREEGDIWDASEINDADLESNHELLPEAALEDKEFQQLILDFIQSLPEAQAQTILLHFRGGMKYQEIADEMGVSLITVKTRMKKAKDSLEEIITKYEKKTGTKLHSVSILPLLWLLYRMASEDTTIPVAVDTVVATSVAGVSSTGAGNVATTAITTGITKVVGTKALIAIVSTTVVVGGVLGISHLKREEPVTPIVEEEQEDKKQDIESDDESGDDAMLSEEKIDDSVIENGSKYDNQVMNEADADNSSNTNNATGQGMGNNSGVLDNDAETESTAKKGSQENPYKIGEKIVVTDNISHSPAENNPAVYHLELTVTDYTPIDQAEIKYVGSMHNTLFLNIVKAKLKVWGEGASLYENVPITLSIQGNGHGYGSGSLEDQSGNLVKDLYNNVEYDIGFHYPTFIYDGQTDYEYFQISFFVQGETVARSIWVKLK